MSRDWRRFFPAGLEPRELQAKAIDSILDAFEAGKRMFVLEAPTGSGKSIIAVTVARYLDAEMRGSGEDFQPGATILTSQKILQSQYLRDFGEPKAEMLELKSATNYGCGYLANQTCGQSRRALSVIGKNAHGTEWHKHCTNHCEYQCAKQKFVQGSLGITNYAYFMAETTYAGKLEPRELLILDEAHNAAEATTSFVEVEITDRFCKSHLNMKFTTATEDAEVIEWVRKKYRPALSKLHKSMKEAFENGFAGGSVFAPDMMKKYDLVDKHICKVNRFLDRYNPEDWVVNVDSKRTDGTIRKSIQFKPIDAGPFAETQLFKYGRRCLMMSATIVDSQTFMRSLGLDPTEVEFLSLPSTFPVENRRIYYMPVGKMSRAEMDVTMPKLVALTKTILEQHAGDKGIIHSSNFIVARYLRDNLNDPRLLVQDDVNRERILKQHLESSEPTVLVSPSMGEGVDLIDDLARFQIIAKLPYPNLGDRALQKRIKRDPQHYDYVTMRSVVQAYGRAVRHENDSAVMYILDGCWSQFVGKNRAMLPRYFAEALVR